MSLFLCIIMAGYAILGAQVETGASAYDLAPGGWVKYRASLSADPSQIDADLQALSGHPLLLTIHNGPNGCGPVVDRQVWISNILALIARYNPAAVELWNEPDGGFDHPELYGCGWSMVEYSAFAKEACRAIKLANPKVITLAGALADWRNAKDIQPGICDGISFHYYTTYSAGGADWAGLSEAIDSLHALGWVGVWITETSLLDDPDGQLQAQYCEYVRRQAVPTFWYTIGGNGWRNSDLYNRPAYKCYNP